MATFESGGPDPAISTGLQASALFTSIRADHKNDRRVFMDGLVGGLAGGFATMSAEAGLELLLDRLQRRRRRPLPPPAAPWMVS